MAKFDFTVLMVAKDLASKTIGQVDKKISGLGKAGARAQAGLKKVAAGLLAAGAAAGIFLGTQIKSGIDSLVELEDATTQVDGAIAQMGLTGKITSGQIATWANDIESSIQAAFDDKAIVAGAANLIRYGKVSEEQLQPAMVVMTDLAAKTGDVKTASELLGKALGDPTKAAGKLSRYGIILTKTEQDKIKAFEKAGKTGKAQAVVLAALERQTKGAAAAAKGPYADAMNEVQDAAEDAQKALAVGFLPVLQDVAKFLQSELAKPETLANIREFGKGLAKGLQALISTAKSLPWSKIAGALKAGADAAGSIISAFLSAPDWLKAAVVGGWGLNKISGGALGGIVGELGKGLIKGVLGMTAAVVNINAGAVNGGGGVGGVGGVAGGAAGKAGLLGKVGNVVRVAGAVTIAGASIIALAEQVKTFTGQVGESQTTLKGQVKETGGQDVKTSLANLNATIGNLSSMNLFDRGIAVTFGGGQITDDIVAAGARLAANATTRTDLIASKAAIQGAIEFAKVNNLGDAVKPLEIELAAVTGKLTIANIKAAAQKASLSDLKAETKAVGERTAGATRNAIATLNATTRAGLASTASASLVAARGSQAAAAAIRAKKWSVTIPVTVNNRVTVRAITNGNTVSSRYNEGARIYEP